MKIKTQQSAAKRFYFTKTKKLLKRKAGQDHFNAREPGKITRLKRKDVLVCENLKPNFKKLMPFAN